MRYFSCDFETTVYEDTIYNNSGDYPSRDEVKNRETRVWLAAGVDCDHPDSEPHITYNIDEFMSWVVHQGHANFTFHNLGGFDRLFIINWLEHNGYRNQTPKDNAPASNHYVGNDKSFTVYTWVDNNYIASNFIDSRLVLQGGVAAIGEQIGTYNKGDETPLVIHGTSIEDTPHADGNSMWTMEEAIEYIKADVQVIASALNQMGILKIWDSGMRTAASMAYNGMLVGQDIREHERVTRRDTPYVWHKCKDKDSIYDATPSLIPFKPFGNKKPEPELCNTPVRDKDTLDKLITIQNPTIKRSYKGGFSYLNPRFINTPIGNGTILDINSMYPWIYSTKPLPRHPASITNKIMQAEAVQAVEDTQDKFNAITELLEERTRQGKWPVISIRNLVATCHPDKAPIIKPSTNDALMAHKLVMDENGCTRSVTDGYTYHIDYTDSTLVITWPEFQYLTQCYNITSGWVQTVMFYVEDKTLVEQLSHHCDYWMNVKEQTKGSERMFAKMMLNSPYGKLGQYTRDYKQQRLQQVNGRIVDISDPEQDVDKGGKDEADLVTASYITAWGRVYMGNTINMVGMDKFIYCDTDSMHIKGTLTTEQLETWGINVHPTQLGAWDIEHTYERARYLKAKHYGYGTGNNWHTVASGHTKQIPEHQFHTGATTHDLRPISAKGGTILLPITMQLKAAWQDRIPDPTEITRR